MNKTKQVRREKLYCFVAELDGDDDGISPTRSLRDPATQDTDELEIQQVSEPERVCIVVAFPA